MVAASKFRPVISLNGRPLQPGHGRHGNSARKGKTGSIKFSRLKKPCWGWNDRIDLRLCLGTQSRLKSTLRPQSSKIFENCLASPWRSVTIGEKLGKIMQNKSPRIWPLLTAVFFSAVVFFSVTQWLLASPSPNEEITQAVAANGTNARQASPDQFIQAFSAVLASADRKQSSAYVDAAERLRPDLKDRIVGAAKDVGSSPAGDTSTNNASGHKGNCWVCCDQLTINLPCKVQQFYLMNHPSCRSGFCHHSG